jgi:hypothetical protein
MGSGSLRSFWRRLKARLVARLRLKRGLNGWLRPKRRLDGRPSPSRNLWTPRLKELELGPPP